MEYNNLLGGRKVIDGHIHLQRLFDDKGGDFIHGVEWYREEFGMQGINLASMPCAYRDVSQNIMCFLYKVADPHTFVHAGFTYSTYPVDSSKMGDMDILTQYKEVMEIGADGIKMLEGKPSVYKYVQVPLCDSLYEPFFAQAEKDKTHILMHACDPIDFWDRSKVSEEEIKKGWFYGDGNHISKEEMHKQVYQVLLNHPKLHLTLAHFFFLSDYPEKLEKLFNEFENLNVDVTPGGEMYVSFNKRYDYFKNFFTKYADRIQFGTDGCYPPGKAAMEWLIDRIYKYVATDISTDAWSEKPLKGLNLPSELVDKIFYQNFVSKVGSTPCEINKKALKAYIEKYKHLIRDKVTYNKLEELWKKML